MGSRYIISGVQIGMIIAMAKQERIKEIQKIIDTIIKKQYVGNTNNDKKTKIKWWGRTY